MNKRFLTTLLMLTCIVALFSVLLATGDRPIAAQDATEEAVPLQDCPAFEGSDRAIRTGYYLGEGEAFFTSGQLNQAIYSYTCAIQIDVQYVPAYMSRAAAQAQLRNYEAAIADYTRALQRNPDLLAAINNRGIIYTAIFEYDEALSDFNEVLALDSAYSPGLVNRGIVYALIGEYESAIADLEAAIDQSGIDDVLATLQDPERPQDAVPVPFDRRDAQPYAVLGIIYSAFALDNYRDYIYLTGSSGDARIQSAAGALESRFSFELRLDDGTWLLVADFDAAGQ